MKDETDIKLSRRHFLRGAGALGVSFMAGSAQGQTPSEETGEIYLRSYAIPNIPGTPVHHELHFKSQHRDPLFVNGLYFDRLTGMTGGERGNQTLRVLMTNKDFGSMYDMECISDVPVWKGSITAFRKMLELAEEASGFMNSQRFDYYAAGLIERGQNSNSVVDTLMKAMRLDYPADADALWAPGRGRILLPANFVSFYDIATDDMRRQKPFEHYMLTNRYIIHLQGYNLKGPEIGAAIVKEGIDRRGQSTRFFDPARMEFPVTIGADFGRNSLSAAVPVVSPR